MSITKQKEDSLPLFLNSHVEKEYERCIREIGDDPYSSSPTTVGVHDVIRAHFLIVDYFQENPDTEAIGGVGPRDIGLLHSAVGRQLTGFGNIQKWNDDFDKLATLFYGLVKNHPFHDSNKRTALLTVLNQLQRMGRCSREHQREWENLAVQIADGSLGKDSKGQTIPRYRRLEDDENRDIRIISDCLRRYTRREDKHYYIVTYRQLNKILRDRGYYMDDPSGGHINVYRNEPKGKGIFRRKSAPDKKRICQIGFRRWGAQVGRKNISTVRKACKLTDHDNVDSQTFFKGVVPMHSLIAEYSDALERLANR